ncbi:hypothetical protein, partial [Endozoicomonas atrinae]|uniref:hypothetical protein n=1 Tax=Endozoicomonas atrinae TaxID=1333660 RepID=UPI001930F55A
MSDALVLVKQLHQEIHSVEYRIRHHPYLKALEARTLEPIDLQYFIGEQRYIISSDLRGLALLISRCEHIKSQKCHHRCNKSSKHQFNLTSRLTLFWPIVFLLVSSREQRHDQSRG